jgi:galactokinase
MTEQARAVIQSVAQTHRRVFGRGSERIAAAPGRVNLIGEHTDYHGGLVMPMAIDRWCAAAVSRDQDGRPDVQIHAADVGETVRVPAEWKPMPCSNTLPGQPESKPWLPGHWSAYVVGVLAELWERRGPMAGLRITVGSSVPMGGGLSSSAALEVATAMTICEDREVIPSACQRAEQRFAGVPCGIMDQSIATHARAGHAMTLDCLSMERAFSPMPERAQVLIMNTGVRHALASGEYAMRRLECERAARTLGVALLREASMADAQKLDGEHARLVRHVTTEIARVRAFARAIDAGDLTEAGRLMNQSHASLRDDYRVSCPELDALQSALAEQPGVLGARMTGGGFGGCVVALAESGSASGAAEHAARAYERATGRHASAMVSPAVGGAFIAPDDSWR